MNPRQESAPDSSGLVDASGEELPSSEAPDAQPTNEAPAEEAEIGMATAQGHVYLRLPTGHAMELRPDVAKSLAGDLLNAAREANGQRKKARREEALAEERREAPTG